MVRFLSYFIVLAVFSGAFLFPSISTAQSCKCEVIECAPCEMQVGVNFYTEACEGGRQKSCQKPKCELPKNPAKGCDHLYGKKVEDDAHEAAISHDPVVAPIAEAKKQVGVFLLVRGNVKIHGWDGSDSSAKVGGHVFEKDVVITDDSAQAKVMFLDKNVISIAAHSRVKMRGFELDGEKGFTSSTIDLVYGKLRSQVVTKPKFADKPTFIIRTPAAVAGVRGTDFITTHMENGDVTKIETLKGTVELGGHKRDEKVLVKKGQYASYVVIAANKDSAVFRDDDIATFVQKGFLTPVYKMTDFQMQKLDIETDYREDGSDRVIAEAKAKPICHSPAGDLNHCAWTCLNNPKGEKHCRTDPKDVTCVRKKCDANGRWSNEERLPASSHIKCSGEEVVVAPCDY